MTRSHCPDSLRLGRHLSWQTATFIDIYLCDLYRLSPVSAWQSPDIITLKSMMRSIQIVLLPLLFCLGIASPLRSQSKTFTPESIYNFTFPIGGENMVQRSNGKLIVTTTGAPNVYQIDPSQTGEAAISLLHTFDGYESLYGIVQPESDVFYIMSANNSLPPTWLPPPSTNSLWRLDLTAAGNALSPDPSSIRIEKTMDVDDALTLDGLSVVNSKRGLLITGDAHTGKLYIIDVDNKICTNVFQSDDLDVTSNSDYILDHFGINGIKVFRSGVYYTNTAKHFFGRVPISLVTGKPNGKSEVLANIPYPDDFLIDSGRTALLTQLEHGVYKYNLGAGRKVNGDLTMLFPLLGANALLWGSGSTSCTLYCLYNQGGYFDKASGLVKVDMEGSGFNGGLESGRC